jgi:hypothetical protein
MKKRKQQRTVYVYRYSLIDVMLASPTEPLAEHLQRHQLTRMLGGLAAIKEGEKPTTDDWRVVSDAVNIMETLVNNGPWLDCDGDPVEIKDESGQLQDAVKALAMAGKRHRAGGNIRLDGEGIFACAAVLHVYRDLLEALPARTMIKAHRETERRIHEILAGKKKPHDVEVMDL